VGYEVVCCVGCYSPEVETTRAKTYLLFYLNTKKYTTRKSAVTANKNQNNILNPCTLSFRLGLKKRLLKKSYLFMVIKLGRTYIKILP
jgi:hypothetical protein